VHRGFESAGNHLIQQLADAADETIEVDLPKPLPINSIAFDRSVASGSVMMDTQLENELWPRAQALAPPTINAVNP
jgi:hypothetical protein